MTDPVLDPDKTPKIERYARARLEGSEPEQAMIDAGYAHEFAARNWSTWDEVATAEAVRLQAEAEQTSRPAKTPKASTSNVAGGTPSTNDGPATKPTPKTSR